MAKLSTIEGIGEIYAGKLQAAGITSVESLLKQGASTAGRKSIAENAGVSDKLLLEWLNHADLMRVNGVGSEYADLLEAAGVDTVPELAQRNPDNLYAKMLEIDGEKHLVRRTPTAAQVADWVSQAKDLPRVITY